MRCCIVTGYGGKGGVKLQNVNYLHRGKNIQTKFYPKNYKNATILALKLNNTNKLFMTMWRIVDTQKLCISCNHSRKKTFLLSWAFYTNLLIFFTQIYFAALGGGQQYSYIRHKVICSMCRRRPNSRRPVPKIDWLDNWRRWKGSGGQACYYDNTM